MMKILSNKKQRAFTLIELMVVVALVGILGVGASILFSSGTQAWFATEGHVRLHDNIRQVLQRLSRELRQTDTAHVQINDGAGLGVSDAVTFSIPIICETGQDMVDSDGKVAYWGAPLTWGCTQSTCMDADNDCSTKDYAFIRYYIDADNQFVRQVLGSSGIVVSQQVYAAHITDLQFEKCTMDTATDTCDSDANGSVVNISISAAVTTSQNRTLTAQTSVDVYLRN